MEIGRRKHRFDYWVSALGLAALVAAGMAWASVDLTRQVRVHVFRPDVFADRFLGMGIPGDPQVLAGKLWYLRMDESVRALAGADGLRQFVAANAVPGLDFNGHKTFNDNELEMLFRSDRWNSAPRLQAPFRLLKLNGTPTDDRALPTISHLYDLQVLFLSEHVSDKGLKFLPSLKNLRVLAAPGLFITDDSVGILSQLPRLQYLSLKGSQISDQALAAFSDRPLRRLDLGLRATDAALKYISEIKTLEHLDVHASRVTETGLAYLKGLPLHTLFLGPSIADRDLPVLLAFKKLKRLDLSGANLSDAALQTLGKMEALEELALTDTAVSDQALAVLSRLPRLRYLELSGTRISAIAFRHVTGFPALQVLSFSTRDRLRSGDIRPLGRLAKLHSVLINKALIGPDLIRALREAQSFWRGDWIASPAWAAGISDADLDHVLEVASLPQDRKPYQGASGLPLIHEAESSLNEVIAAPAMINVDNRQDSEKNFLGEFTVGVASPKSQSKKRGNMQ